MAKKLGELVIALIVLTFIISAFSLFIGEADSNLGVSSGEVAISFSDFEGNLSELADFKSDIYQELDNTSNLEPTEGVDYVTTGDNVGGLFNVRSKNIVIAFFNAVADKIPQSGRIMIFLTTLVSITIVILGLRFWRGETKI